MDPAPVVPPSPRRNVTYAGFWKRFAAYLIDGFILCCVSVVFLIPLVLVIGIGSAADHLDEESSLGFLAILLSMYLLVVTSLFVIQWLYFALMESTRGATLGKMALGVIVTDMDGNRPSFGRASGRYFAKIISGLTLGLGYVIAGFSQQKQALHDMISGCLVINKPWPPINQ
jgi:uncharacterized RDD family membrane protein YckC